jgi:[FeFe] hydrogenase (group B1/B3)
MNNKNQEIDSKKEVLEKIIKAFFSDNFEETVCRIPLSMRSNGYEVLYRCCVYKERVILRDRVIAGLGFSVEYDDEVTDLLEYAKKVLEREYIVDNKPLTLIETACQGCVPNTIYVTDVCQGCVARSCETACKFGAVSIINNRSKIDSAKCKNCKMCIPVCPYNAIVKIAVPCEDICPVDAIKKNENGTAKIDYNVCILCGKCMMACPFGVINEKSQIVDVLKNIKIGKKVVAMLAPSIVGQFQGSVYQLKAALKKVGFCDAYEVAEGADISTRREAFEFAERMESGGSFMTTSCCASYNQFIKKHLPEVKEFVSTTKTPMYYIAQKVKNEHPEYITVFISPCVAKKNEACDNENVNYVINYEELDALFSAKDIKVQDCVEERFEVESSKQGRSFGITGGVVGAVAKILEDKENFVKPYVINGLNKETIKCLKKKARDEKCFEGNLVEVMGCEGGCIGGNATICTSRVVQKAIKTLCDQSKDIEKNNLF